MWEDPDAVGDIKLLYSEESALPVGEASPSQWKHSFYSLRESPLHSHLRGLT